MSPSERWRAIDRFFAERLLPRDAALDAALDASAAAALPPIQVAPNQGMLLHLLALAVGARRILEIGTLGGYSTIWLARAVAAGGQVVTLEIDAHHADVARANLARAGVAAAVDLRVGAALQTLPRLAAEAGAPFDFVFIDADKASNAAYFGWALKLARVGSLIVVDNVVREGAVIDPARAGDTAVEGVLRLLDAVRAEPRVAATVLQSVGEKGHDGLLLARVMR